MRYRFDIYGIDVSVTPEGAGSIVSDLSQVISNQEVIDTIESFILCCALEGVDISDSKFSNAINTTIQAITGN